MLNNLRKSFIEKGIPLKESWLHSMIDSGLNSYDSIFVSLLNTDISETCDPCPLSDISHEPKFIFHGNNQDCQSDQIFLQINEVVDISLPLEKRRALERSDRSTFKILLTDGISFYVAISKKPITSFSTTVTPGSKIFIKTPIESSYGIIFLSEEKIDFLDGKSDPIIEHRNYIYSKIKQSKTIHNQNHLQQLDQQLRSNQSQQDNPVRQIQRNIPNKFLNDSNDDEDFLNIEETITNTSNNKSINDQLHDSSIESEFDSSFGSATDHSIESETDHSNKSESDQISVSDDVESIDESDFDSLPLNNFKLKKKLNNTNNNSSSRSKPISTVNRNKIESSSLSDTESSESVVIIGDSDDDILNNEKPISSKKQTHYLLSGDDDIIEFSQFTQLNDKDYSTDPDHIFTVNELKSKNNPPQEECFETVKTSATVTNCYCFKQNLGNSKNPYSLNVTLKDSTGDIAVKVDPNCILNVIKILPEDMLNLENAEKEEIARKIENHFKQLVPPILLYDGGGSSEERYTLIE